MSQYAPAFTKPPIVSNQQHGWYRDLTGMRFDRLLVKEKAQNIGMSALRPKGYVAWLCVCDCGKEFIARASRLLQGVNGSCGCLRKENGTAQLRKTWRDEWKTPTFLEQRRIRRNQSNFERRIKKEFGLSFTQYNALISAQGGTCAICGRTPKIFNLDHCHTKGHIRGALCSSCNRGLGLFKDNSDFLLRAAAYLERRG